MPVEPNERWSGPDRLAVDEPHFSGARSLGRLFGRELDPLTFAEQLEHGATNRRAMKEVLDTTFVANEAETLVDEQTCNRAVRHDWSFDDEAMEPREARKLGDLPQV